MEFIEPEQFLNEDKEVQKVIDSSIELRVGDRIYNLINKKYYIFLGFEGKLHKVYKVCDLKEKCIGVFAADVFIKCPTEGQLRKFIEDKKGKVVSADLWDLGYEIVTEHRKGDYERLGKDLLQAYWKVAIQIVKESLNNENSVK